MPKAKVKRTAFICGQLCEKSSVKKGKMRREEPRCFRYRRAHVFVNPTGYLTRLKTAKQLAERCEEGSGVYESEIYSPTGLFSFNAGNYTFH